MSNISERDKKHTSARRVMNRSLTIKKNITVALFLQFFNFISGFIQVSLILEYTDAENYGIWLTLTSLTTFLFLFDAGLGNGLRNRFGEAFAEGKHRLARVYVSTTYVLTFFIVIIIGGIYFLIEPLLNWPKILNAPLGLKEDLRTIAAWCVLCFCVSLVLKLVTTVFVAMQKSAFHYLQLSLTSLFNIVTIIVLLNISPGSIKNMGIGLSLSPVISLVIISLVAYSSLLKIYSPAFGYFNLETGKKIMGLGIKFFILQMGSVIVFQIHSIMIAQLFGPVEVTTYNIAYRYFGVMNTIFMIVIFPFWSGFTDAYIKQDYDWIRRVVKKLIKIWAVIMILGLGMLTASNTAYRLWLGSKVIVPIKVSAAMYLFFAVLTWGGIFISFVNGIGKINYLFAFAIVAIFLTIPVSVLLAKTLNMGVVGIILTSCLMNASGLVIAPWQYYKEIYRRKYIQSNNTSETIVK